MTSSIKYFADQIRAGYGWISPWDISRQWEGLLGYEPDVDLLIKITEALAVLGLINFETEEVA